MSNLFTSVQFRGGTKEEHLTGNGTGFVGNQREITVDTTDYRLRVHDGVTVGGIETLIKGDAILASCILFDDGISLQEKFNDGELGGGGSGETSPSGNSKPQILAVDIKNKNSNGEASILYFAQDLEEEPLTHKISLNNGVSFEDITPTGTNPFAYTMSGLMLGQNLCAIQVSDGELIDTKYFIVEIPIADIDTPPEILTVSVSEVNHNSFKLTYEATDKEDDIQSHKLSIDNGFIYKDIIPNIVNDKFEYNLKELMPSTNYNCRLKVIANGLESLTYGISVETKSL